MSNNTSGNDSLIGFARTHGPVVRVLIGIVMLIIAVFMAFVTYSVLKTSLIAGIISAVVMTLALVISLGSETNRLRTWILKKIKLVGIIPTIMIFLSVSAIVLALAAQIKGDDTSMVILSLIGILSAVIAHVTFNPDPQPDSPSI
ncbi:MAG: hypothetical protein A3B23_00545 [Candidatus Colwellbacteria bacterium RIFCSPLOWO2_01_FULL_48_10]|uniref:Uncharacterized protein n=1 Tax=Candidatus Colwellbacteria bacterium RIFCSPLOWO2_01_FULL_48_10 TaxID=1797690 RepID=A0A1G1Z3D7_9BACT|nr:MAG: hypothetical protein A3B23_00545 [Candidatus Colwellbacteria bacterium RIFCSPLOWO2_01_FULL_48_10]